MRWKTCLLLFIWLLQAHRLFADTAVVPSSLGAANGSIGAPFFVSSDFTPTYRYQQVYGASSFKSQLTSPISISLLSFNVASSSLPVDVTLPDLAVHLSTTQKGPDALSATFSANLGVDDTMVFSGPIHFVGNGSAPFEIQIPLQLPFVYDPSQGNLLVDVFNYRTLSPSQTFGLSLDAALTVGDDVSVATGSVGPVTGGRGTGGLVTLFTGTPVPEPAIARLVGLAMGFLLVSQRRGRSMQWQRRGGRL